MKKERKPLGDALASEFVYGSAETTVMPVSHGVVGIASAKGSEVELSSQESVIEETLVMSEAELQPETTLPKTKKQSSPRKLSIMEKLLPIESKEATKRFTVDLAESMHRKLSILSAKTGRTKAEIVRTLLEDVLQSLDE